MQCTKKLDRVVGLIVLLTVVACGGSSPAPQTLSSAKRDKIVIGMSGDDITESGEQLDAASLPARNEGCGNGSQGRPGDYTAPTLPGFTISAPLTCDREHGAYIRIERTSGARKFGIDPIAGDGFLEGWRTPPACLEDCPLLNWELPTFAAEEVLARRGIRLKGHGTGPCGDIEGDFAAWNASLLVTSWADAATALRVLAEQMKHYDVAGYLGVSVSPMPCSGGLR